MKKQIGLGFTKASYILLISFGLNLIFYLLQNFPSFSIDSLFDLLFSSVFLLGSFFLIRRGYGWMKWVLLIALIEKIYRLIILIGIVILDWFSLSIGLVQIILLLSATIFLFRSAVPDKQITIQP